MAWLHHGCGCGFEATLLGGRGGAGGLRERRFGGRDIVPTCDFARWLCEEGESTTVQQLPNR